VARPSRHTGYPGEDRVIGKLELQSLDDARVEQAVVEYFLEKLIDVESRAQMTEELLE